MSNPISVSNLFTSVLAHPSTQSTAAAAATTERTTDSPPIRPKRPGKDYLKIFIGKYSLRSHCIIFLLKK